MTTKHILGEFFADLDQYPAATWLVRVTFPEPSDPSLRPRVTAGLAQALAHIAAETDARCAQTGPLSWTFLADTESLPHVFIKLEVLITRLLGAPDGTIDITPCAQASGSRSRFTEVAV